MWITTNMKGFFDMEPIRVKTYIARSPIDLEEKLNKDLKRASQRAEIIDIKYAIKSGYGHISDIEIYSAMVIYRKY